MFKYCTAIEAMQLWRNNTDTLAPIIQFSDRILDNNVFFVIETDEEIFSVLDDQYRDSMPAWVEGEKYLVVSSSINESPWALNIIDFDGNRYLLTDKGGSLRYAQWTK